MGKRARRRAKDTGSPASGHGPSSFADIGIDLELDVDAVVSAAHEARLTLEDDHGALILRTAMSPGTRSEYVALLKGERSAASAVREDTWHRAVEFLFERLAVGWEVAGVLTTGQRELLARLRAATQDERLAVRDGLRAHLAAHFPDLTAP
jgi:hypothetical protein